MDKYFEHDIVFDKELKEGLLAGVTKLAKAVKGTLGPRGNNVLLRTQNNAVAITKDGVSVADSVVLLDPIENLGARVVKDAAKKTGDLAGDGTTTAIVLAEAIYVQGLKAVQEGMSPIELRRGILKAADACYAQLDNMAIPCDDEETINHVASVSANNSQTIGKLITEAMMKVGKGGVVTVEEGTSLKDELKIRDGMQYDRGYLSPYFVNNEHAMTVELDNPAILIHDDIISNIQPLIPLLEGVRESGRPLLVIAQNVKDDALTALVVNKMQGVLQSAAVRAPGHDKTMRDILEDIAIFTGGKVISAKAGLYLKSIKVEQLGGAKRIIITQDTITIIEGGGKEAKITGRINNLKNSPAEGYKKEQIQNRIAKLSGGIAVIQVGGATEIEIKEKKDRIDDALHATRAAVEEGIVAGGGVALVHCKPELIINNPEQLAGVDILIDALSTPLKQIAVNSGQNPELIHDSVVASIPNRDNIGYNARTNKYVDMIAAGILDPVKVTKTALRNAVSIATMLLTANALVFDELKKDMPK